MSQCVPSWDLDDITPSTRLPLRSRSNSNVAPDIPLLDYEVAELTWENGQIAMHGLGPPRVPNTKHMIFQNNTSTTTTATHACHYAPPQWEKPRAGGTLESIVNQATRPAPPRKTPAAFGGYDELVPWFDRNANNNTNNMDAKVPCAGGGGGPVVASCSGAGTGDETRGILGKRVRMSAADAAARVPVGSGPEWSGPVASVSGTSTTFGSHRIRVESCERDFGVSMGSPENGSSSKPSTKATAADEHDSVCHSRLQRESGDEEDEEDKTKGNINGKSSISTKRSRAAAIHNQSERKRRDKINQRMKTLQKLVPNSSKTDKASMLDEVIDYLKQLQAQVQMMSRMHMPAMMLPVAMQQQLQLSMMSPMGMGMGMGMGMDINNMARPNLASIPPILHPNPFMQMASWDGSTDGRLQPQLAAILQDPLSSFFTCQSQPMTAEAYSKMAAMYQQLHQPPASSSKS